MRAWMLAMGLLISAESACAQHSVHGVVNHGTRGSIIHDLNEDSGEAITWYIDHKLPIGQKLKTQCIDSMFCRLEGVQFKERDSIKTEFRIDTPIIFEVTKGRSAQVDSGIYHYLSEHDTDVGALTVNDDNQLLLNGKPTRPAVEGNDGLSIVHSAILGEREIVVLMNSGGSGCPGMLRIMDIQKKSYSIGPEFGTCSVNYTFTSDNDKALIMDVNGYAPPHESAADREQAEITRTRYIYEPPGRLLENGQPVR